MTTDPVPQNREISWLSFNERVLQEAEDQNTLPISRLHFLGIVSSNLDDFYRVRVGSLNQTLLSLGRRRKQESANIHKLLDEVRMRTLGLQERVSDTLFNILKVLKEEHNILLIDDAWLNELQYHYVKEYFRNEIRPCLTVIMNCSRINLNRIIKTDRIYLVVELGKEHVEKKSMALIELPTDFLPRFVSLPRSLSEKGEDTYIWLDDIIRVGIDDLFAPFGYNYYEVYTIKLTRNAEMTIDDDIVANYIDRLSKKIRQREHGNFVRLTYDASIPADFFKDLLKKLDLEKGASVIAGGKYHNTSDFVSFAAPEDKKDLVSKSPTPIVPSLFHGSNRIMSVIEKEDVFLHYPYHSFNHIIHLLREASLDASVKMIYITIYRLAKESEVADALINALHNGKRVFVFLELKARFDEEANIAWVQRLEEAGAQLRTSLSNYKVHSKLIHIVRKGKPNITVVATGNFNEKSAKRYSDMSIITADSKITTEVQCVFDFLKDPTILIKPNHLLVAPRTMRDKIKRLIKKEIKAKKEGAPAYIKIKINNLVDNEIVECLEQAASKGVPIDIVVRSTCSINPDAPKIKGRIRIVSIIDEFLEHSRILIFANRGDPLVYISSADLMKRNLDHRIEVACPIYSKNIKKIILSIFDLHLNDNCKARIVNGEQSNPYQVTNGPKIRVQRETWKYLQRIK